MIREIAAAVAATSFLVSTVKADDVTVDDKPVIMTITETTPGPVNWTALSPEAVAAIMAEKKLLPERIKVEVDRATSEEQARCEERVNNAAARSRSDIAVVQAQLDATKKERDLALKEAAKLERRAKLSKVLMSVGAGLLAAGAGLAIGFTTGR